LNYASTFRFLYFLPCFVISLLAAGAVFACIWLPVRHIILFIFPFQNPICSSFNKINAICQEWCSSFFTNFSIFQLKDLSRFQESSLAFILFCQETLHFHNDDKVETIDELEAQVVESNSEGEKDKESIGESTKNLLKNWQLMSAVILYCVFSLHDIAYLEVISVLCLWILGGHANSTC
jgi:hypothetical protein